ncbi:hypothetical protein LY90DRAFT_668838 [Neocallimastix californiae]|uniref:Cyclin N-terminal domain-containing protein n=1 Tax=Neocallimastix californiae TaxID=1754190 RepID=A0A1Y2DJA8_9FUNG|nr:hypothetical protein LY90DRAFT_668838 [Neocallimastix californiae]|eukprot:ORY59333.1 hypothetical protein LY90DRAFT_668838 [Neocallimastix californiae]
MISNSLICSPFVSPFTSDNNVNLNNQIVSKKKIFSCSKYPSEKKEIQSMMNIKAINNCYHSKKSVFESSLYQSKPETGTENNQNVKKELVTENFVGSTVNNKKKDMKEIIRNTNLVCFFLRTFNVNILKDENDNFYDKDGSLLNKAIANDLDSKNHENRSLEHFVAIILAYTILDEIFVYVSLLFVHRYLSIKARIKEVGEKTVNNNILRNQEYFKCKTAYLILAAMICASKYLDDNPYSNAAWQKLTKRSISSISELEREFLMTIDYKLYFSDTEWQEWKEWITNYKLLLESSRDSCASKKCSLQSCITVPSQSFMNNQDINSNNNDNNNTNDTNSTNEYQFIPLNNYTCNNSYNLPSPYSTRDVVTDTFPVYNIPVTFNKEKSRNINSITYQNNPYLLSIPTRAFSIENYYSPYSTISLYRSPISPLSKNYQLYCEENDSSQYPLTYNSFYSMENYNSNNCNFSEDQILLQNKMLHTSYNIPNEFLYSYSTLEKNYAHYDYNIDTTLFNQENSFIDFSEIIQLYQEKNLNFKPPVFPSL